MASGEHAVGSTMLLCVVYTPDPILVAVGMGEVGIVGAIERHRELAKRTVTTIRLPGIENGGRGPTMVIRSVEGKGCSGEGRQGVDIVIVGDDDGQDICDLPYRKWGMHGDGG